jgi:hypothetical protein
VDTGAGVLFIVKNYEGDVMNFDMAREMAGKEGGDGHHPDDDVAVETSTWSTGRRGVAGTLVVEKIVGAAAEEKRDLASLKTLGDRVNWAAARQAQACVSVCGAKPQPGGGQRTGGRRHWFAARWAHVRGSDPLPDTAFLIEPVLLDPAEVALGYNSQDPAVADDRHMPKTAILHQPQRLNGTLAWPNGGGTWSHHLAKLNL